MMTFEDFKKFIAEDTEDKKYFSEEKMYAEYLENGYFSYTTADGLFKEAYWQWGARNKARPCNQKKE